jgi:TolA-binding protein
MNKAKNNLLKIALALAFLAVCPAMAQQAAKPQSPALPGVVTMKNGAEVKGAIRWMPQGRKYVVSMRKGEQTISQDIPASDVARVQVAKPEKLDAAIAAVKAGKSSAAVPVLESIVKQYAMLGWDEPAARWLAKAKLDTGDAEAAMAICEGIIKVKPSAAYVGEVAPTYWAALLKTDKKAKLNELLVKAIANGDEDASAAALVMRGDILMEQKEPFNALKDGYLRAVLLYERSTEVQPEALYKAAKAFEQLSKNADAQKMRDQLRKRYPRSEWAGKL